eukprot:6458403-Amphidinium_carterae.1
METLDYRRRVNYFVHGAFFYTSHGRDDALKIDPAMPNVGYQGLNTGSLYEQAAFDLPMLNASAQRTPQATSPKLSRTVFPPQLMFATALGVVLRLWLLSPSRGDMSHGHNSGSLKTCSCLETVVRPRTEDDCKK